MSNFLDFFKIEAGKQLDVVRTEMNTQVCEASCFACFAAANLACHTCVVTAAAAEMVPSHASAEGVSRGACLKLKPKEKKNPADFEYVWAHLLSCHALLQEHLLHFCFLYIF